MTDIAKILEELQRAEFATDNEHVYMGNRVVPAQDFYVFLQTNDLGLPLAIAKAYNLIILTDEGEAVLQETWQQFCELTGIRPDREYEGLGDALT